jgi:hypothetical protein
MSAYTIGADPEFFLRDTRTGTVVPAIGLIGGTKEKPVPIPGLGKGYAMQEDNVMVEFNIPPVNSARRLHIAIVTAIRALDEHIAGIGGGRLERDNAASRLFSASALTHPQAMTFGCSPDFDAYTGGQKFAAVQTEHLNDAGGAWRFAGGHVHLGYREALPFDLPEFVMAQFMDLWVGADTVAVESAQGKRKEFYGLPGRFRPTPYGLEYRSLSNLWIHNSEWTFSVGARVDKMMWFLMNNPVDVIQDFYGVVPWPSLRAALVSSNSRELAAIYGFLRNHLMTYDMEDAL